MSENVSVDRARVYGALARVFQPPTPETSERLSERDVPELPLALVRLGAGQPLVAHALALARELDPLSLEQLDRLYLTTFEPAGGLACLPNETAHASEAPGEGWARTFQLADIAGFYRAFGVEVQHGTERVDHLTAELEFMNLLAVKEAIALERGEARDARQCRAASAAFVEDHLSRWCAKLRDRLHELGAGALYRCAADLLADFVELDARLHVPASKHRSGDAGPR